MADLARSLNEQVDRARKRRRVDGGGGGGPPPAPRSLAELVAMSNRALGDMPAGQHVLVQDVTDDPDAGQVSYEGLEAAYEETMREEVSRLLRERTTAADDLVQPRCYLCEYGLREPQANADVVGHYGYVMILNYIEARLMDDDDAAVSRECERIFYRHTWAPACRARGGRKPNFPRLLAEHVLLHMQNHSSNPHITSKFTMRTMKKLIVLMSSRVLKNNAIDVKLAEVIMKAATNLDKMNDKYMKVYSGRSDLKVDMRKLLAVGNITHVEPFLMADNRDAIGGATATDNDAVRENRPVFGVGGGDAMWEEDEGDLDQ